MLTPANEDRPLLGPWRPGIGRVGEGSAGASRVEASCRSAAHACNSRWSEQRVSSTAGGDESAAGAHVVLPSAPGSASERKVGWRRLVGENGGGVRELADGARTVETSPGSSGAIAGVPGSVPCSCESRESESVASAGAVPLFLGQ